MTADQWPETAEAPKGSIHHGTETINAEKMKERLSGSQKIDISGSE